MENSATPPIAGALDLLQSRATCKQSIVRTAKAIVSSAPRPRYRKPLVAGSTNDELKALATCDRQFKKGSV